MLYGDVFPDGSSLTATPPAGSATVSSKRRTDLRKPPRSYDFYKAIVDEAMAGKSAPSRELIQANKILTAWEAFLGIGKVSSFPVTTQIGLTDICNARCSFCIYSPSNSYDRKVGVAEIERLDWLKFVERFSPNAGLNEPLVNPNAIAILDAVRRQAPFIKMFMVSNASIMDDAIANGLLRNLDNFLVSLNAVRKSSYETLMSLPWETTVDNLKRFVAARNAAGATHIRIQVSIVVHMRNLDELVEAPALLASLGLTELRIIVMSVVGMPIADRKVLNGDDHISRDPQKTNRVFAQLESECRLHGVTIIGRIPWVQERTDIDKTVIGVGCRQPVGKDVSKEYLYPAFEEEGSFCLRPWRMLKVDLDRSTMICNGSFTRMPKFDFPTMKEFHQPDKMWNHPFMQHLRSSRGKENEVPFCTFCLDVDKRHPANKQRRKAVMDESRTLFRKLDTESRSDRYTGRLHTLPEALDNYEVALRDEVIRPFGSAEHEPNSQIAANSTRSGYRWLVHARGFHDVGHVLMLGLQRPAYAPFLAESCQSLTVGDSSVVAVRRAGQLCRAFGLPVSTATIYGSRALKFADESFDRIWADGAMLCSIDLALWLPELRRILKPSGAIFVHKAPALGAFLTRMSGERHPATRIAMNNMLRGGLAKHRPIQYVPARDIRVIMSQNGFKLDRNVTISKNHWAKSLSALDRLKDSEIEDLKARYLTGQADWKRPGLIEYSMDFSMVRSDIGKPGRASASDVVEAGRAELPSSG